MSIRHFTWRHAIKRPIWVVDRHWYAFMGRLYLEARRPRTVHVSTARELSALHLESLPHDCVVHMGDLTFDLKTRRRRSA